MGVMKYKVLFKPDGVAVDAGDGDNLLELARKAGVALTASCGGDGVCGTCKVLVEKGEVESPPGMQLDPGEVGAGYQTGLPVPGQE